MRVLFAPILLALVWLLTSCGSAGRMADDPTSRALTSADRAIANEMLRSINSARASGATCGGTVMPAAPRLRSAPRLLQAAKMHSEDMLSTRTLSHTGSDGSNPGKRIARTGYAAATWGENAAAGQDSVESVVSAWLRSAGHCRNLMNPVFTEMGGARAGHYWTLVLARPH